MLNKNKPLKIAVAGTGYVGISNGILLAQHNEVVALGIIPKKIETINCFKMQMMYKYYLTSKIDNYLVLTTKKK